MKNVSNDADFFLYKGSLYTTKNFNNCTQIQIPGIQIMWSRYLSNINANTLNLLHHKLGDCGWKKKELI